MRSVSATPPVPKSHIHMVTVLANFSAEYHNSVPDEPLFLKKAIASPQWKDFEKAMHAEFEFFIENDTSEYRNAPQAK